MTLFSVKEEFELHVLLQLQLPLLLQSSASLSLWCPRRKGILGSSSRLRQGYLSPFCVFLGELCHRQQDELEVAVVGPVLVVVVVVALIVASSFLAIMIELGNSECILALSLMISKHEKTGRKYRRLIAGAIILVVV